MTLPNTMFGGCPHCWSFSECLNIGRDHWFICHDHRTAWLVGSNLFSSWQREDDETWKRNAERLKEYEIVSTGWLWLEPPDKLPAENLLSPQDWFAASDPDAAVLLDILRRHWTGKTFVLGLQFAEALSWEIERLQRARLKLIEAELIQRIDGRAGDLGPRYRFAWDNGQAEQSPIAWDNPCLETFYGSDAWRRLRYDTLNKRGGRCECCGATAKDGVRIVVDHIKPIRRHWHLRLDPGNLQVLCDDCNRGKGSRDETDWRSAKDYDRTNQEHILHPAPAGRRGRK